MKLSGLWKDLECCTSCSEGFFEFLTSSSNPTECHSGDMRKWIEINSFQYALKANRRIVGTFGFAKEYLNSFAGDNLPCLTRDDLLIEQCKDRTAASQRIKFIGDDLSDCILSILSRAVAISNHSHLVQVKRRLFVFLSRQDGDFVAYAIANAKLKKDVCVASRQIRDEDIGRMDCSKHTVDHQP